MIGGRRVLVIVPARGGSKGLPGKNVAIVGGRPLLKWTIDAAAGCSYVDQCILSTDDLGIAKVAEALGCCVPFLRDSALARDDSSSIDVVLDAINRMPGFEIVVLLQPTSPLRTAEDVAAALELLHSRKAPAVVSIRPADDHPHWTYKLLSDGTIGPFVEGVVAPQRRQDLDPAWCLNGAIYAAEISWFVEKRSFVSSGTIGYPMPVERSIDIDTMEDLDNFRTLVGAKEHRLA